MSNIISTVTYLGELRTECHHLKSGEKFITDAPLDNNGKGQAFSPTDLTSTSLGACLLTLMGIAGNSHDIDIKGTVVTISKFMASEPRRISKVGALVKFGSNNYTTKEKKILERAALTCPVAMSLHPDIEQDITFVYE